MGDHRTNKTTTEQGFPAEESTLCAVYYRVSSDRQTLANQVPDVERFIRQRGMTIDPSCVYTETKSAAKQRPVYDAMLEDGKNGKFQTLVVWSIDRFGRSMMGNLDAILALDAISVKVVSVREVWLDTRGPIRELLIAIFSWVAQQERTRLIERVRAAQSVRRDTGKAVGRAPYGYRMVRPAPQGDPTRNTTLELEPKEQKVVERARELRQKGENFYAIASDLSQNFKNRKGGPFTISQVHRMLTREPPKTV
jgi:putative DNA-invertase from lambdoid prophage Rac